MEIIKRDGRKVEFNKEKIIVAIGKAMQETGEINLNLARFVADNVELKFTLRGKSLEIEEVQDMVESELQEYDQDVFQTYSSYRRKRTKIRNKKNEVIMKMMKVFNSDQQENSNANINDKSFSGREEESKNIVLKDLAIESFMSQEIAEAHKESLIYQHDLSKYVSGMHNCLQIDFDHILNEDGFTTRNGDVRPAKKFDTACQQLAVIFQCQTQVQFGGVAASHLDVTLAPFVANSFRKHFKTGLKYLNEKQIEDAEIYLDNHSLIDTHPKTLQYALDLLENEGRQGSESLYHNLNTLESRAGSQVPFTSVNFGRDTSTEGRLVIKWLLQASISGVGKLHKTSIFPIGIFQYKSKVNDTKDTKNYDLKKLAIKSMVRRIYPNWVNGDWSQANEVSNKPDTWMSTMGK